MLVPFIRTLILYILILAVLRLMGKRQVGELQPTELVVTVLVSAVASVPLQDVDIPLSHGVVPILTLMASEMLVSHFCQHHIGFRRLLTGNPVMVIRDGQLLQQSIEKLRLNTDDLLAGLRLGGYFDIRDIRRAVVETNGQLSVMLKSDSQPPAAKDLGVAVTPAGPFYTLISDGRVISDNLSSVGRDRAWLEREIKARGCRTARDVFFLCADENGNVIFTAKEGVR